MGGFGLCSRPLSLQSRVVAVQVDGGHVGGALKVEPHITHEPGNPGLGFRRTPHA